MKRGSAACILLFVLLGGSAFGQNTSFTGTWKLDIKQSDFGSEPPPKSLSVTLKDTGKIYSLRAHGIDAEGKSFSYSWSGPEDGSMHPLTSNGKVAGKMNAKKEGGALVRHSEDADGSVDYSATLSSDGNTATDEMTGKSKDGKDIKQKAVFHRISPRKSRD